MKYKKGKGKEKAEDPFEEKIRDMEKAILGMIHDSYNSLKSTITEEIVKTGVSGPTPIEIESYAVQQFRNRWLYFKHLHPLITILFQFLLRILFQSWLQFLHQLLLAFLHGLTKWLRRKF
ncbi:hypothetical protein RUND412_010785 [Rhizina undulata]